MVQERYELSWNYFENTIKYKDLALPDTEDVLNDINKLNALQRKMQQLAFKFDSCMQQYNSRLADNDARITGCEVSITEQLNRASSKFAASATKHYTSLSEYAATTFATFQSNLQDYADKFLTLQCNKIKEMHHANHQKINHDFKEAEEAFQARIEAAIERAVQEILSIADDATDNINEQAQHLLQQLHEEQNQAPCIQGDKSCKNADPKPSKLFPNVNVSHFASVNPTNQPRAPKSNDIGRHCEEHASYVPIHWDKNGPKLNVLSTPGAPNPEGLPPVNNHDFLKRVHLPYPGKEQSYIWYLQLRSNAQQYGIYLIPTEQFEENKSLCPTEVSGYAISVARYDSMKCSLYHFLAQRSIISIDHTDLRNIINRQALTTDGYRVLYDIMQCLHPALNTDATFALPQ